MSSTHHQKSSLLLSLVLVMGIFMMFLHPVVHAISGESHHFTAGEQENSTDANTDDCIQCILSISVSAASFFDVSIFIQTVKKNFSPQLLSLVQKTAISGVKLRAPPLVIYV